MNLRLLTLFQNALWWALILACTIAQIKAAPRKSDEELPKGSGVMIFNVISDLSSGSTKSHIVNDNAIKYLMPSLGSVTGTSDASVYGCTGKYKGEGIDFLAKSELLGESCIDGAEALKQYRSFATHKLLLPLFSVDTLPNDARKASLIGESLGCLISKDPNADGISLDYELQGQYSDQVKRGFFSGLQSTLGRKILAVFDIGSLVIQPSPIIDLSKNVINLESLYDLGTYSSPSRAITLEEYSNQVSGTKGQVSSTLHSPFKKNIPTLFVLPASATDTIYTNARLYNYNQNTCFKKLSFGSFYPLAEGTKCFTGLNDISLAIRVKLEKFLCQIPNNECSLVCLGRGAVATSEFMGLTDKNDCLTFSSPESSSMLDYVNIALAAIAQAVDASNDDTGKVLGVVMYSSRVENELVDAIGAKAFFNTNGGSPKQTVVNMPQAISEDIWVEVENWQSKWMKNN